MELVRSRQKRNIKRSFNVESLGRDSSLGDRYAVEVQNGFDVLANLPDDVELMWEAIRDNITSVASKVIGYKKRTRRQWLSAEADRLISLKREAVIRGDHQERNRYKREFKRTATAN